jgi:hypothetical protein
VIAWRRPQIPIGGGVVDHLKLAKQLDFQIGRDRAVTEIVDEEASQPFVSETNDHAPILWMSLCTTQWDTRQSFPTPRNVVIAQGS